MSILLYGYTTWILTKRRVKAWRQLHKDALSYIKQILETASHKTEAVQPTTTHLKDHPN